MRRILGPVALSAVLISGCSSVNSSESLTPEQASAIASDLSEAASGAADEAVQQYVRAEIANELEAVALAIKEYADLGGEMQRTGNIDMATLSQLNSGISAARTAVDGWNSYVASTPGNAAPPGLQQDLDAFTTAVNAYVSDQEQGYEVWERCLTAGKRNTAAATCILESLDAERSVEVFEEYVSTLKALGAELGMRIT